MAKGLTYKVFPDMKDCPIKIMSLTRRDHVLLSKVEIPTFEDYKSAPYFRCKVTVVKSTALHANFQLLSLGVNTQIPLNSSSSKAFKPGKQAKTSSQPSNGNLNGHRPSQPSAAPISGPSALPAGTTSVLAIYIFERDDHSHGKFDVFTNGKQVFVIPTSATANLIPSMAKGLSYKVFLDQNDCPIKILSLARLDHVLFSKIEIPTYDDYKSAPYY